MSVSVETTPVRRPQHEVLYITKSNEKTFQYDEDLPSMPVPPLQQTLDRYLDWARPHLTKEEYGYTKDVVRSFGAGLGKDLHEKLLARAAEKRNWLEDWWLHYAYLMVREPILPTMNTCGPMPLNLTLWKPSLEKAPQYGSLFLWTLLNFYQLLREQRLQPQKSKEGSRLSMNQFRRVFNCSRIPGQGADSLYTTWKTKDEGTCPQHLIVLCKGHIWTMNPWDSSGQSMTAPELEVQLEHIKQTSEKMGMGPCLPVLTCDTRENWAKNRDWLKSLSLSNAQNLEHIDSSMFVFVLDDSTPADFQELCWEALCGDTNNRWADKSLSAIITKNGFGALNNDHSPYDAMATVVMSHYLTLLVEEMNGKWNGSTQIRGSPLPTLLHFTLDHNILEAIPVARKTSSALIEDVNVRYYSFPEYGKDFIKRHKLHPDAYVQSCMQLAYMRLHNKPAPTYETATTRQFYNGRTETLRSCTIESVDWCHAMLNPTASIMEKRRKLVTTVNRHSQLLGYCQKNEGVDRHLFGLYILALEAGMPTPEIFLDPAYAKSGGGGNFILSSSTTGYTTIVGGVSAMVQHGYGCFYNIRPENVNFFVSNYKSSGETSAHKFCQALADSLREMQHILTFPNSSL